MEAKSSSALPSASLGPFGNFYLNQANASSICFPNSAIHTTGIWLGDNPLNYPFDLLMFQLGIISIVSTTLYVIFKPLGYPAIVHQILAGIVLGRSFLCQDKVFMDTIFPTRGSVLFETLSLFGLIYYQFLIGVRTDARLIVTSGKRVVATGMLGYFCPVVMSSCAAVLIKKYTDFGSGALKFAVVTHSLSSSAVISYFLSDLKILNTELGRLATSSAVISDSCAMTLYALYKLGMIAKTESAGVSNLVGTIVSGAFLWTIALVLVWAAARWVINRTPKGMPVTEVHLFSFVIIVLACTLFSQFTGQGYVLVPFMVGLAIPDGPPLGSALEERLSTFVGLVLMPIFFTMCGLKSSLFSIDKSLWGVQIIVVVCFVAKTVAVMLPNIYFDMPIREAFVLGLIMNSKGLVELSFYNTWFKDQVLNRKDFSVLVFALLLTTLIVSRVVQTLYNPATRYVTYRRRTIQHAKRNAEIGILTCINNQENVPNIIHFLDVSNPSKDNPIHICVVHLVELVGRASSLLIAHNKRQGKVSSRAAHSELIVNAFRQYEETKQGLVSVDIYTSVSPSATMHDDLCSLALEKRVSLIIIPFHRQWVAEGAAESSTAVRNLNCNVLQKAPCSVGILISHKHLTSYKSLLPRKEMFWVSVLFLGGADDREALSFAMRMVENETVKLTLIRLTSKDEAYKDERMKILDSEILNEFKNETLHNDRVWHKEEIVADGPDVMSVIRSIQNGYDLVMVGRRHMESPLTIGLTEWMEHPELGMIGDILATPDFASVPSVLVVQQQARVWGMQTPG